MKKLPKKVISALTALVLAFGLSPASAFAALQDGTLQAASATGLSAASTQPAEAGWLSAHLNASALPGSDSLLAGYVQGLVDDSLPVSGTSSQALPTPSASLQALSASNALAAQALPADNNLTSVEKKLLAKLKPLVAKVAAGTRASTVFEFDSWDLDTSAFIANGGIDRDSIGRVITALCTECPYEMYWHDVVGGVDIGYMGDQLTLSLAVAYDFQGSDYYSVDAAQVKRAKAAIAKAKSIVKANAGKTVLNRLEAYRDAICKFVSYDSDAAAGYAYGRDPWQLIAVFDGDSSTDTVCEGYSKAFQYLCDLSGFSNVNCYTVSGLFATSVNPYGGNHMWNVIAMDDGRNYLVDVTNCDGDSIGSPDKLFMACAQSGSVQDGYTFQANGLGAYYVYDDDTLALLDSSCLNISGKAYAGAVKKSIAKANVKVAGSYTFTGKAQVPAAKKVTVTLGGKTLVRGTDYTVSYKNAKGKAVAAKKVKAAGKYTLVVKGKGAYKGTATGAFTIKKAANSVTVKASSKAIAAAKLKAKARTVAPLVVKKAAGKVAYAKASGSKYLTVNKATGKVKVAKGTPAGTYKIKVKVKAAGTANYKAKTKTATAKVKVK